MWLIVSLVAKQSPNCSFTFQRESSDNDRHLHHSYQPIFSLIKNDRQIHGNTDWKWLNEFDLIHKTMLMLGNRASWTCTTSAGTDSSFTMIPKTSLCCCSVLFMLLHQISELKTVNKWYTVTDGNDGWRPGSIQGIVKLHYHCIMYNSIQVYIL